MVKTIDYTIGGYSLKNIRNKNEEKVIISMRRILNEFPNFCGCDLCIEDVYALSLNSLKPKYQHHFSLTVNRDNENVDIDRKIKNQIRKVMKNPNHQ